MFYKTWWFWTGIVLGVIVITLAIVLPIVLIDKDNDTNKPTLPSADDVSAIEEVETPLLTNFYYNDANELSLEINTNLYGGINTSGTINDLFSVTISSLINTIFEVNNLENVYIDATLNIALVVSHFDSDGNLINGTINGTNINVENGIQEIQYLAIWDSSVKTGVEHKSGYEDLDSNLELQIERAEFENSIIYSSIDSDRNELSYISYTKANNYSLNLSSPEDQIERSFDKAEYKYVMGEFNTWSIKNLTNNSSYWDGTQWIVNNNDNNLDMTHNNITDEDFDYYTELDFSDAYYIN